MFVLRPWNVVGAVFGDFHSFCTLKTTSRKCRHICFLPVSMFVLLLSKYMFFKIAFVIKIVDEIAYVFVYTNNTFATRQISNHLLDILSMQQVLLNMMFINKI
jgi:hypothetical protein